MSAVPWPSVYDTVIYIAVTVFGGLVFFLSAFLYNNLCSRELLTPDSSIPVKKLTKWWEFLAVFAAGLPVSALYFYMVENDSFDLFLLLLIPVFTVAALSELKNRFVPMVASCMCALCAVCRIVYYSVFYGFEYGLTFIIGGAVAAAALLIPRLIFMKREGEKEPSVLLIILLSSLSAFFSWVYAVVFLGIICLSSALLFLLPDFVSGRVRGKPFWPSGVPTAVIAAVIFNLMLII